MYISLLASHITVTHTTHILHYNKLIMLTLVEVFVDTIKPAFGNSGSICKAFKFFKIKRYSR